MGIEIERKYIIVRPNTELLSGIEGYTCSKILQTYIESEPGTNRRVRRREFSDGRVVCTETVKRRINAISAVEDEHEITPELCDELAAKPKEGTTPLTKVRHTFPYGGRTVEVDIYPAWEKSCIMEIELTDPEEQPEIPDFIEILRDVTGIKEYKNAFMATRFPEEII